MAIASGVDVFIPEFWSTRLLRHLDRVLIYAQEQCSNRDWEGEISEAGDTVHIQKVGDPTIFDYEPGVDMPGAERPDSDTLALVVDQFKAFNVGIDSVEKAQANVNLLDKWATRAGVRLAQVVDAYVASLQVAAATNEVGSDESPVVVAADGSGDLTPYELAVELRRQLAAVDAPLDSLWVAISPDLEAEFLKDPSFIEGSDQGQGGGSLVRTGQIGRVAGFDVLRTTGVPTTASLASGSGSGEGPDSEKILAGAGNYATTFAQQLTELTAYSPEKQFGDAVKGLEVYGAKVVEPETLAVAHVGEVDADGSGSGSGSGS